MDILLCIFYIDIFYFIYEILTYSSLVNFWKINFRSQNKQIGIQKYISQNLLNLYNNIMNYIIIQVR